MKRTAIVSLVLLSALGLGGCSAANSGMSDTSEQSLPSTVDEGGAVRAADGSLADSDTASAERSYVTTGFITVTAEEPIEAAAEAITIVEAVGGRVDSRQEYAPVDGDRGSATLTLRIPATAQTATIAKLRDLGEVQDVSISSDDVTTVVQDLDGRITALRASVDRLLGLLATASDAETLVTIESSLSQRQGELESLLAQQRNLDDQVSLSTITLTLQSVADAPVENPDTFLTGLETGWGAFVGFLSGLLVLLGVLLPWLIFLAVLLGIAYIIYRARKRRVALPAETSSPQQTVPAEKK